MPVLNCISGFVGTFCKKFYDTATSPFISCCFTSVDWLLQVFKTSFFIIGKKEFVNSFPFLMDLPKSPPPQQQPTHPFP